MDDAKAKFPSMFLLRHGETEWNAEGRLQGHLDSPLTETGQRQAKAQGRLLAPVFDEFPDAQVFSSSLGRAAATAEIALSGCGRAAIHLSEVQEISAGSWDGKRLDWIEESNAPLFEQARNAFELMFLSPDGETEEAVISRAKGVLAQIDRPTVIFTHGAFLCVLRGLLRGLPFDEMLNLTHEQGCIYRLEDGQETILR